MLRRPPRSTLTDTLFPSTTLFRSRPFVDPACSALPVNFHGEPSECFQDNRILVCTVECNQGVMYPVAEGGVTCHATGGLSRSIAASASTAPRLVAAPRTWPKAVGFSCTLSPFRVNPGFSHAAASALQSAPPLPAITDTSDQTRSGVP